MALDTRPAEPLTSRQISKLVSGLMTSLVPECGSKAVIDALNHFVEHQQHYEETFKRIEVWAKSQVTTDALNELTKDGE